MVVRVPEDPTVRMLFTGRIPPRGVESANLSLVVGGGDVGAARRAALARLGTTPARTVFMEQVHGGDVAEVTADEAGAGSLEHADAVAGVDAVVTRAPNLALAVLVADCVPVLLVDPGRAVGAVHAGRAGVVAGVVPNAVRRLATQGPEGVVAVIGPAIGGCCYEVPAAMADSLGARWPGVRATTSWGTPSLDLPAAVEAQLEGAGVAAVRRVGSCTRCDVDRWFSHRATSDGAAAGRQAGLVVRAAPDASGTGGSLESQGRR